MNIRSLFSTQMLVAVIFIMCVILIKYFGLTSYLSLSYVCSNINGLHVHVCNHYFAAVTIYMVSFILAMALSLPGSSFFLTAAGLLFNIVPGIIYANIAATIGATMLFLTSRYIIGDWVQKKFAKQLSRFNHEIADQGYFYLLMVRFIAIIPCFTINLLSGLTLVPTRTFLWTTSVGMIPSSIVFAFAGKKLAQMQSPDHFFSPPVIIAFVLLVLFKMTLLPLVYRHFKKKRAKVRQEMITN